ncbi:acyltransferase family protein [Marinactinospora rubrisoli]|uniref:Acyltransferase family protein n=1 Tax=Marinactinospora rubrisoli TaxID=2715399 RepID=A0ABW2KDS8_9ACTN
MREDHARIERGRAQGPWRSRLGRLGRGLRGAVERVERATPPDRERAIDGLRALAICGVVLGHWLVTALVVWADGGLRVSSSLRDMPAFAPLSWVLQMLGLFFLVGGYVAARGLERARARGEGDAAWLRRRLVRLVRPVLLAAAVWGLLVVALPPLGVPAATVRSGAVLTVQPMWFIAVYVAVTALTGYAIAADARFGVLAAVPPLAFVAVVDLLRYGPWHAAVPDGIGLLNALPVWLFAYQLGVSWARGGLTRPVALTLLLFGTVGFAVLVGPLGYPASAVGIPGAGRSNSHPPSLFVPMLAMTQIGAAVLLRDRLERALRRPILWTMVAALNVGALTIFCWHQTALVAVSALGVLLGPVVPGLTSTALDPSWIPARLLWLPAFAAALAVLLVALRRFESPWDRPALASPWTRGLAVLLASGYVGYLVFVA